MCVKIGPEQTLQALYEKFGWDLYDKYGHAFDAFRLIMSEPEQVFKEIDITEEEKKVLLDSIARKMAPTPVKIRADFELTCFTYEGIDALKAALLTAKAKVTAEDSSIPISFKLIAPPHYRCETVTLKKNEGLTLLETALKEIETVIKERGGTFKLVNKPQVIGDSAKDKDLEEIMKMPGERDSEEGGSSAEEDNDEGMGDIDLGEDGEEAKEDQEDAGAEEDSDGEEEKKVEQKKKKKGTKKKSKKAADSDDEDDA